MTASTRAAGLNPAHKQTTLNVPLLMLDLYVKTWCPWCIAAIETLDALGCAYTVHDVEKEPDCAATVRTISGQSKVPTMSASGGVLADFGPEEIEPFLRKLGTLPERA